MSAFAYVRQFFSPLGVERFAEVFPEHRRRASSCEGFVSLRQLRPLGEPVPNVVVTLLEFANETLLLRWRASEDHGWVAAQYGQWWVKPPEMLLYTSDE